MTGKTILIVDDSEFDRMLLTKVLERKLGVRTLAVSNGEDGLKLIEQETIDLILMDIMLPGRIGTDILLKIRKGFNPIELPIIMVTAKDETFDIIACLQAGANDYITKPMNLEIIATRIKIHLKMAETYKEMSRLNELKAISSIIATYNHEINNPLTVAMLCLDRPDWSEPKIRDKIVEALTRVEGIVQQIKMIATEEAFEYKKYAGDATILKIKP